MLKYYPSFRIFSILIIILILLFLSPKSSYAFSMDTLLSDAVASFLGEAEGDYSGDYVSPAGDVNGDGFDDFLIGAYSNEQVAMVSGKVYLIFGKKDGWSQNLSLTEADASFINNDLTYYYCGEGVSGGGDVNGDGFDDILIGCYGGNGGVTYLILGKPNNWNNDTDLSAVDASFLGENTFDSSGVSVSIIGDVNNDGFDDFIIGALGNDEGGSNAGQTYLILGKSSGWVLNTSLSDADASFWGETEYNYSGTVVSKAGDVNGDGFGDFIIGAEDNDDGGNDSGQTYLIFGKETGWTMDIDLSNADASFWGESEGDQSGGGSHSLADAGDVNGDGYDDFLIGANMNSEGGSYAGQTYLILGKPTGWGMDTDLSNVDCSFLGENPGDYLGDAVFSAGDVNEDGFDDFLIGADGNDEGGNYAGQTYLVLGKSTGWTRDVLVSDVAGASYIGEATDDSSGWAVSGAGDVNNDGADDILIGAFYRSQSALWAGKSYLILGEPKPKLFFGGTGFSEIDKNDGSVIGKIIITLIGDFFQDTDNDDILDIPSEVIVNNIPTGLIPLITLSEDDTKATLTLSGNAINHSDINSITNITFDFQDGVFVNTASASDVQNATNNISTGLGVTFIDGLATTGKEISFWMILSSFLLMLLLIRSESRIKNQKF